MSLVLTGLWCVVIRRKDGTSTLASNGRGAAVYWDRPSALKFAKELRECPEHFKARVEKCEVEIHPKRITIADLMQ